jgi:hypothetical protein
MNEQFTEERIALLLRLLPPAPLAWVRAAQELPAARRTFDEIVTRAEADLAFRDALIADLEQALAAAGYEPDMRTLDELRERYANG